MGAKTCKANAKGRRRKGEHNPAKKKLHYSDTGMKYQRHSIAVSNDDVCLTASSSFTQKEKEKKGKKRKKKFLKERKKGKKGKKGEKESAAGGLQRCLCVTQSRLLKENLRCTALEKKEVHLKSDCSAKHGS